MAFPDICQCTVVSDLSGPHTSPLAPNRKYGASKLRFPQAKEFRRKLSAVWVGALENIPQPFCRPIRFKDCRCEGAPSYYCARGHPRGSADRPCNNRPTRGSHKRMQNFSW